MEQKLSFILNQQAPIEEKVVLLDQLTLSIKSNKPDSKIAHDIWRLLKQDHYFWYNSAQVLRLSKVDETKVFMLIILEQAIKQKWLALPSNQREHLKSYIVNIVLEYGAIENLPKSLHNILSKANSILVQIVKYQWNSTWRSFINDICSASVKDMNICQNNFFILKMLSQQIFDYSKNQMTQQQIAELKTQMNEDFTTIYQLCDLILQNMAQAKQSLIKACLETLHVFLSWIPIYYIVYTDLIEKLISILSSDFLRNFSLQCLVQIACLPVEDGNQDFKAKQIYMIKNVTISLNKIIPLTKRQQMPKFLNNIKRNSRHAFQILSRQIIMFYSQFFKSQYCWIIPQSRGNLEFIEICKIGLQYILMLMHIEEDQVFKIAIQFFHFLVGRHLNDKQNHRHNQISYMEKSNTVEDCYPSVFTELMQSISLKMAKPEEVLIVIDQSGYPVRQELENTQNSSLYEIMKELASYLANYDWPQMKKFILYQIQKQQNQTYFSFDTLNSLSWIVGSLCGAILQKEQKQFFISTLRTLLHLCQMKKGKENKAVIASCIMYVVGQYPTFLRNNWTFLKTVVRKLFEFMKEQFPGIMEMACRSFLKIVKATADQFVQQQPNDSQPYINEIILKIPEQTKKLHPDMKLIFYQAVGYIIGAQKNSQRQLEMMKQTLGTHLIRFENIMSNVQTNPGILKDEQVQQQLLFFLKINENLAIGVGQQYVMFLEIISEIINKIYLYYSNEVNESIKINGKNMLNFLTIKSMRSIKKQILKVYINYLQKCNNLSPDQGKYILQKFIFPLGTLLQDFQDCLPQTKEQEFVTLFTLVLQKLSLVISPQFLSKLLDMIFASSLPLITTDFNSFPEIRANFFSFLKALIKYNFGLLYALDQKHFTTILDCVIWSFRHQLSNYSDLGLQLIEDILNNVNKNQQIANAFYPKYHIRLLTDILDVMTDGFHKSGLQAQAKLLWILVHVVTQNLVMNHISPDQQNNQNNYEFLFNFLVDRLSKAFSNLSKNATAEQVNKWFKTLDQKVFKEQIGDYLIMINRFSPQQIKENTQQKTQTTIAG